MPPFAYEAKSAERRVIRGVIEARSKQDAARQLGEKGCFPIKIESRESILHPVSSNSQSGKKIPLQECGHFFRQISDLLCAGVPLFSALKMAAEQNPLPHLRRHLPDMAEDVRQGKSLSEAMASSGAFAVFYVQLVSAGEMGGMLPASLERLADITEKEEESFAQTRAALAYPAFIAVVGLLTVVFLLTVVVPRIAALFLDVRDSLPLPTKILIAASGASKWILLSMAAFFAVGAAFLRHSFKEARIKMALDRCFIKVPCLRDWITNAELAQYCRTLGLLLQNGVPLARSLAVALQTLRSPTLREALRLVETDVRQGLTLSRCLSNAAVFPAYVCNLIAVSEAGGRLAEALLKISETLDRQAQRQLKVMISLIEPVMILVIGAVLGTVVIAIMLPIFDINAFIR